MSLFFGARGDCPRCRGPDKGRGDVTLDSLAGACNERHPVVLLWQAHPLILQISLL
jgi:hypothetical protein